MHRILGPLRRRALSQLQDRVLANKPQYWYSIFLAIFVLLHNYELGVVFQVGFAARRKAIVRLTF